MPKSGFGLAIVLFFSMFALGGLLTFKSWDGMVFVYLEDARSPAAIQKSLDFSHLNGSDLLMASQKRLVSEARVLLKGQARGLQLGHFVTKDPNGKKVLACHAFDRVSMEFMAEGVAVSGEIPQMTVEGLCKEDKDMSHIQPIWIPVDRLLGEEPADMEFQVWDKDPVSIRLTHLGSEWPRHWRLVSVRLYNTEGSAAEEISINAEAVRELRDEPLRMEW